MNGKQKEAKDGRAMGAGMSGRMHEALLVLEDRPVVEGIYIKQHIGIVTGNSHFFQRRIVIQVAQDKMAWKIYTIYRKIQAVGEISV